MEKIIIFCAPNFNYLVSTDVISQYFFFKNTKEIFKLNNYEIIYFYEFLEENESIKYKSLKDNYRYDDNELISKYKIEREFILKKIIESPDYNNCILIGFESIGFDAFFYSKYYDEIIKKNIKIIISKYDLQSFSDKKNQNYFKIIDSKVLKTSYIISPTVIYFKNINWEFYDEKCRFIPFSFNPYTINYTELAKFENFFNRKKKILLNGATLSYKYRNILWRSLVKDDKEYYQYLKDPKQIEDFKEIFEYKLNIKYNRSNLTFDCEQGGLKYCKMISEYMAYFIFFGTFPIDFPLIKILECMLAGCLAFIETKDYLLRDFGLIEYVHYVPVLFENEKIDLDFNFYKKYLGTDLGKEIAQNGHNYIINNFSDQNIAKKYVEILKNL